MQLQRQTISHRRIVLDNSEANVLGPDLVLEDCEIVSSCDWRSLTISGVTIRGGSFQTKVKITDRQWKRVRLQSVRFLGHYSGCDFGGWEGLEPLGSVVDCDFAVANIDNCRFMNCDIDRLHLPRWPWFTVRNPRQHARDIVALSLPGRWHLIQEVYADAPEQCSAIVGNATILAKRLGGSLHDIRSELEKLSAVSM
jgi:hypothetical protein